MANQQHIEWLLEGVEAWNARREQEEFMPDFEGADLNVARPLVGAQILRTQPSRDESPEVWSNKIRQNEANGFSELNLSTARLHSATLSNFHLLRASFERASLRLADMSRSDFSAANMKNADLAGAILTGCMFLGRADLRSADLRQANLTGAVFSGKHPQGIVFGGKFFGGALLDNADVTTSKPLPFLPANEQDSIPTDLSSVAALTQDQLNSMRGDSGTILPEGLTRPEHWPDIKEQPTVDGTEAAPTPDTIALRDQVSVILSASVENRAAAELVSDQLDAAVRMFRAANPANDPPDDLLLIDSFSTTLRRIGRTLEAPYTARQADLERDLAELRASVRSMERTIRDQSDQIFDLSTTKPQRTEMRKMKSAFAISFGATLGTGTAAAIISAGDAILGSYGASAVQQLRDAFSTFFNASYPP